MPRIKKEPQVEVEEVVEDVVEETVEEVVEEDEEDEIVDKVVNRLQRTITIKKVLSDKQKAHISKIAESKKGSKYAKINVVEEVEEDEVEIPEKIIVKKSVKGPLKPVNKPPAKKPPAKKRPVKVEPVEPVIIKPLSKFNKSIF